MLRSDTQLPVLPLSSAIGPAPVVGGAPAAQILVCLKGFGPGGVERIALRLVDGWRSSGIETDLLVASDYGPMRAMADGLAPVVAPRWPLIGDRAPLLRLTITALRSIRQRPPAILFCPGNAYTVMAVALKLLLGRGCPPIVAKVSNDLCRADMHPVPRALYRLWLRLQGRLIDHVAALSAPMAEEVVQLMRIPRDRVHIVPNPVLSLADCDKDVLRSPRATAGRRFVAVGRLERQKDYPAMLRAFAAARVPGDRLTIYGEGRERLSLERLAQALGLGGSAEFAGHCSDIRARLVDQDVLLLSSAYEGQPGAVVEALSVGLWIVATRCCAGMAALLDDGALGTLVDRDDGDGLIRAIAAAQHDRQDQARARGKARYSTLEAAVPAYAALFAAVLAQRVTATTAQSRQISHDDGQLARMGSI